MGEVKTEAPTLAVPGGYSKCSGNSFKQHLFQPQLGSSWLSALCLCCSHFIYFKGNPDPPTLSWDWVLCVLGWPWTTTASTSTSWGLRYTICQYGWRARTQGPISECYTNTLPFKLHLQPKKPFLMQCVWAAAGLPIAHLPSPGQQLCMSLE